MRCSLAAARSKPIRRYYIDTLFYMATSLQSLYIREYTLLPHTYEYMQLKSFRCTYREQIFSNTIIYAVPATFIAVPESANTIVIDPEQIVASLYHLIRISILNENLRVQICGVECI